MWTLRLMSGKEITLSNKEAEAIGEAVTLGAKLVKVKSGLVINPSTISEMVSDEEMLAINPIVQDPDWFMINSDNYETRNSALMRLDRKYPLPKFQKEWDEANASKKALVVEND